MNITLDTINIFEAIRIITACIALFLSSFAALNASQGELMIPRVRRKAVRFRRRFQMFGFAAICFVSLLQSLYAATLKEPEIITTAMMSNSIAHIVMLLILILLTVIHIVSWWYEGSVIRVPLQPDSQERMDTVLQLSQQIRHTSGNALMLLSGFMEMLLNDPNTPPEIKADLERSLSSVDSLISHLNSLGDEIKSLDNRDANTTK